MPKPEKGIHIALPTVSISTNVQFMSY
jgi:hypothetical protein